MTVDSPLIIDDVVPKLRDIAKQHGFENPEIKFLPGSNIGDGYVGITSAILIKEGENELKIFAKVASSVQSFRTMLDVRRLFLQEIHFYENVYSLLSTFYRNKTGNTLNVAPECYKTSSEEGKEMIFMSNLRERGFSLHEKGTPMNKEVLQMVLTYYAKFHATSFSVRDQNPDVYENLTKDLSNILSQIYEKSGLNKLFDGGLQAAIKCFDASTELDIIEKLKKAGEKSVILIKQEKVEISEYTAVIHGDCWSNNMMFKYKEDGVLDEVRLLDFQIVREDTPIFDVSYFFYANASKQDLDIHEEYLTLYYNVFSDTVKRLGSDPSKIYPYEIFQNQWKKYSIIGLPFGIGSTKINVVSENKTANVVESIEKGQTMGEAMWNDAPINDECKRRMRDLVIHFVENEYI